MKTARIALVTLAALVGAVAFGAAATAQAPPVAAAPYSAIGVAVAASAGPVGVDVFYRNLAPYGYWVQRPNYGWVWTPRQMRYGWRPYSAGRWVYSDYGWTWAAAASEPWGWATYHYGRWYDDPNYGWQWVPGTDWGPAWVSWQSGGGYLGWAPLPPAVGWSAGVGLDLGGFNLSAGLAPDSYCFVPTGSFLAVNVGAFIVPAGRNVAIFHQTTNITNYGLVGNHVFNRAFPVETIQRATGQRVPTFRVANGTGPRAGELRGNSLALYRPAVERRANTPDPAHVAPRSVIAESRLAGIRRSQGWAPHAVAGAVAAGAVAGAVAAHHQAVVAQHNAVAARQHQAAATANARTAAARNRAATANARASAARNRAATANARAAAAHQRANHGQAVTHGARQRTSQVQHHNPPPAQHRTVNRQPPQRQNQTRRQPPQRQNQTRRQPQQHQAAAASQERRQAAASQEHRQAMASQQHRNAMTSSARHQAPAQQQARREPASPPRQPQAEARRQAAPPQQHQQQAPARRPQPPQQQHQAAGNQEHREKPPEG